MIVNKTSNVDSYSRQTSTNTVSFNSQSIAIVDDSLVLLNTVDSETTAIESICQEINGNFRTTPPRTTTTITHFNSTPKRHIMISYNCSSRRTVQKIYNNLIKRRYKVWMDKVNMGDNVLMSMAQAVENSYIVLLCINQQYYQSHYCRLEAEYAAEKRIKFIPCLMEKAFCAESWLGIIKGSSLHVDFSSPGQFDEAFEELIRIITIIETQLSLQPRRTPTPSRFSDPDEVHGVSAVNLLNPSYFRAQYTLHFDTIIEKYKKSINKDRFDLKQLQHHELLELIDRLRLLETPKALKSPSTSPDTKRSHEATKNESRCDFSERVCFRLLDQNDRLLDERNRLLDDKSNRLLDESNRLLSSIACSLRMVVILVGLFAATMVFKKAFS